MNKGFTLIEVIIYIALFSLLIGTAFIAAHQLTESSSVLSTKNTTQEEGNFILRKINFALTGIFSFTNTAHALHVNKYDGNQIDITLVGTKIKMTETTGPTDFISTDNISVTNLQFIPTGGAIPGITATVTITKDGIDYLFSITKYIRT